MQTSLTVLFEDNHCLAVAKPAPMLTQCANPEIVSLESLVKDYIREKYAKTGRIYLGIPHRLDRPVSGVVLFARQTKSAQRLAEQFQIRQVAKIYWAVVEGAVGPRPPEGIWEDWLLKEIGQSRSSVAAADTPGAKRAMLCYKVLAAVPDGTLLEMRPETGRTHQLRVQAATRGWPIRGDHWYGAKLPCGPQADLPRERVIALHARRLTFLHPIRFEPITVEAPLPPWWQELGIDEKFAASRSDQPCADVSP
jgi:23S rRNA pseudouridine1911/1915/1917 synthase